MKKKIYVVLLAVLMCFVLVGCTEKKEEEANSNTLGGWELKIDTEHTYIPSDAKEVFKNATEGKKIDAVALLGTQVVAGTNYMFLAKEDSELKVLVIYKDLDGKASITYNNKFDLTKYVSKDVSGNASSLAGGWNVYKDYTKSYLDTDSQKVFDDAISNIDGTLYSPVTLLATQLVAGTNYAFLVLQSPVTLNPTTTAHVLTVYKDLQGNTSLTSSAYINLADYNK